MTRINFTIFFFIVLLCLTVAGCNKRVNVEQYDVVTIARVDTFKYDKSGMSVVFNYFVENKKFCAMLSMNREKMIPKGFPIYIRYSSADNSNYKILTDSTVVINDSLQVRYMHKTAGGFTYKIEKRQ